MDKVIAVSNLVKSYGTKTVLNNFSITVNKGEVLGLMGENGAGKTTAIECMLGVKQYSSGSVNILGLDPHKQRKQLAQRIGVQFQNTCYQDGIKVQEVCEMTQCLYDHPLDYHDLLKQFELHDKQNYYVNKLSGGEQQRLSILMALIPNPELIFLDELTTSLDPRARRTVLAYIKELKRRGLSMVLVSHFIDEIAQLCDKICILKNGAIAIDGSIPQVITQSGKEDLEEAYLWYTQK